MKIFDIAWLSLIRSFRSAFAVIFMFGMPLMVTALFVVMFGSGGNEGFSLPQTKLILVNLDKGDPGFAQIAGSLPASSKATTLGAFVLEILQQHDLADLIAVQEAASEAEAYQAVDGGRAGLAVVLPEDFSAQYFLANGQSTIRIYQDPTLTIGPAIVRSLLGQFIDSFSGIKIALSAALAGGGDPAQAGKIVQDYMTLSNQAEDPAAWVVVSSPSEKKAQKSPMADMIGPIMGAMIIFYAFYTGAATAQSILREEEEGTLPRLFTTPTQQSVILGGKFLGVFVMVFVQVFVLMLLGSLVFKINWGSPGTLAQVGFGLVISASTFGIFVNSVMKNTHQSGVLFGGVLTFTGMLGMIRIFTIALPPNPTLRLVSLFVPQGWVVDGLIASMNGAKAASVTWLLGVMLLWSVAFFALGVWRFQKRYA